MSKQKNTVADKLFVFKDGKVLYARMASAYRKSGDSNE